MSTQLDATTLTALATVLSAIGGGVAAIITAMNKNSRDTKEVVVAGAEANRTAGDLRDTKIHEIHILVNSRLMTVLRLLVAVTRKEAARTGAADDISAYEQAKAELTIAEASARNIEVLGTDQRDAAEVAAGEADAKLATVIAKVKRVKPNADPS